MRCYRLVSNKLRKNEYLRPVYGWEISINQTSEKDLKKVHNLRKIWLHRGTEVIIGSRKEGTPRIPVTGYIIGDRPKRELDFTSKTLIILKRARKANLFIGWMFDSTRNTNLTRLGKINKGFRPKSAWDILFITGRPWIIYSQGRLSTTGYWVNKG